jgi:hypothetical protein
LRVVAQALNSSTSSWARSTFYSSWCWRLGGILISTTITKDNRINFERK